MCVLQQRFKHIKECLKHWNRESFSNITQEKHRLKQQLEAIQTKTMMEGYLEDDKNAEKNLMQEIM